MMNKRKIAYSKLTFILSVLGFMGSIGFYFGVLREVYSKSKVATELTVLKTENKDLKTEVKVLTKIIEECKDNE